MPLKTDFVVMHRHGGPFSSLVGMMFLDQIQSDQLLSSPHLQSSCPHHSFTLRYPQATNQYLDSVQSSSHLLPHCLWCSSSIPELLHLCSFLLSSLSLRYSVFLGWAGGLWERDPFNTFDLRSGTLILSLSGIRLHSLTLELKTHLFSSAFWSVIFFLLILPTHHQ